MSHSPDPAPVRFRWSPGLVPWLRAQRVSLAVTTYEAGKLLLISAGEGERPFVFDRTLPMPMGLAVRGDALYVVVRGRLLKLVDAGPHGPYDRHYVPRLTWYTSDVDGHDLAMDARGPVLVATEVNALVRPSETYSFETVWHPPFLDGAVPGDRCHLNGVAVREGAVFAATLAAPTTTVDGWRAGRFTEGQLWSVADDRVLASGLCMPHSPRWHEGGVLLHESGAGRLVRWSPRGIEPLVELPGFGRGLAVHGRFAVVGVSRARGTNGLDAYPVFRRLRAAGQPAVCGVLVVDLVARAIVAHFLVTGGRINELYDIAVLPDTGRAAMAGFRGEDRFQTRFVRA